MQLIRTLMSVHLDAVLLQIGVVGFTGSPVGVTDGRVVLPPAPSPEKSSLFYCPILETVAFFFNAN